MPEDHLLNAYTERQRRMEAPVWIANRIQMCVKVMDTISYSPYQMLWKVWLFAPECCLLQEFVTKVWQSREPETVQLKKLLTCAN